MITDRFEIPSRFKLTGLVLLAIGILSLVIGAFTLLSGSEHDQARFWISLLQNSVYFLFMAVSSVFIMSAAGAAQGAWIVTYRRVTEAIGANVWVFGAIALVILFAIVFGGGQHNPIFHWVHPGDDEILQGKAAFLNPGMFVGFSVVTVALWSWFGIQFRKNSLAQEKAPIGSSKLYWKMVVLSAGFLFVYALTMMSTTPWFWIMSINAHWYSTLFSWYVFSSAFVSGMAVVLLFVVYLKVQGHLRVVGKEHIHDLGKFLFAFSIFWTYLWFSQFMLIWYGNIPEETSYFKIRMQGPYSFFFFLNIIINFVLPILILMTRPSKRNYFLVVFMAFVIIFGHWIDFYLMVTPEVLLADWTLGWYEIGIPLGFAGLMMTVVSKTLAKSNLVPVNNVLLKESLNHVS